MPYAKSQAALEALRTLRRREPNGRHQRPPRAMRPVEAAEKIMAVAKNAPHRRHAADPLEPKLGDGLGRLLLEKAINVDQYNAGEKWRELHERHGRDVEGTTYRVAPQTLEGGRGRGTAPELDPAMLAGLRREWAAANEALHDTGDWRACYQALTFAATLGHYPRNDDTRGALRTALNALHRLWR